MAISAAERIQWARTWLSRDVFPLWTTKGIDITNGSFIESLTAEGQPTTAPRRAMVQARQIYAYSEGLKMKILNHEQVLPILEKNTAFLLEHYALPSGAFIYSIDSQGKA